MRTIKIPYTPRPLWASNIHKGLETHRFSVLVCHRRFGKTVGVVNHIIKMACLNKRRAPQYAYIAPFFNQAKKIAWEYLKYYTAVIPGVKVNNADCFIELPTTHRGSPGAKIYIFGADNATAFRGMYFDGVVLDEFGEMKDGIWEASIRPTLSDRQGWAVFLGTPKGQNAFYQKYKDAVERPDWFHCLYKASETGILPQEELESLKQELSEDTYRQEMECDFNVRAFDTLLGVEDIDKAAGRHYSPGQVNGQPKIMGVDIARFGGDRSCIVKRHGLAMEEPKTYKNTDTMTLAGIIIGEMAKFKPDAVFIDSGAMGAGVIDRIRQLGHPVIDVAFGSKADDDNKFFNKRTEMYFRLADWIKKDGGGIIATPGFREELANIQYGFDNKGRLKLKSKEEIRELLGRSPDEGDAAALTFAYPVVPKADFSNPARANVRAFADTKFDLF